MHWHEDCKPAFDALTVAGQKLGLDL
jgi:hypothetical protein